jgi:hypothetical protein
VSIWFPEVLQRKYSHWQTVIFSRADIAKNLKSANTVRIERWVIQSPLSLISLANNPLKKWNIFISQKRPLGFFEIRRKLWNNLDY